MPYIVRDLLDADRIQRAAKEDAELIYRGYRPTYEPPTAKDRKRIVVTADCDFSNYKMMVQELDRLMIPFDDPIIYVGGILRDDNSYQNNMILGWAKYNHYQTYSFEAVGTQAKRNQKLCNICTHLVAFHNGKDPYVKELYHLAKSEELRIKQFRF